MNKNSTNRELANYCTELREQLLDAKENVSFLIDSKAALLKTLLEKQEQLNSCRKRIEYLEHLPDK
jgi:predicted nuclease with TOPRIM domain